MSSRKLFGRIGYMSGHSKWSTIKHQKAIEDNKRGAVFTKIAKKIHIAVKKGGSGDVNVNPFLRECIEEARQVNMPTENIKRAIDKASGVGGADVTEEVVYEAYSTEGVGILITAVTDNRNRTASEINSVLNKHSAKLGGPGSVSYMKSISPVPMISLGEEQKLKVEELLEALSDLDDTVDVWSNLD
ncbi:MAG TPA: YebC/PmpR family DNA-binding transcriptional regulator [Candidatus Woesebacteria bacterium]|nr:YebC/PmpR family DNA-binding transcriptional regulator [Candidatus Woesebacteria bacterium]